MYQVYFVFTYHMFTKWESPQMGARIGGNEPSGGEIDGPEARLAAAVYTLGMEMDENVFPLKGSLQKDFLVIFRKEGLQLELLLRKPIGFEG